MLVALFQEGLAEHFRSDETVLGYGRKLAIESRIRSADRQAWKSRRPDRNTQRSIGKMPNGHHDEDGRPGGHRRLPALNSS
jgi:hypothetical protein